MSDDVKLDTRQLDQLLKAMKQNLSRVKIGILGAKTIRNDVQVDGGRSINASKKSSAPKGKIDVTTNAAVGVLHEFGTDKIPARSFLRMPITTQLQKRLESSGAFDKDAVNDVVKQASFIPWLKKLAVLAEGIVAEAFETGGFGNWAAWKTPGYRNKNNRLLDDTGQLKDSITSEVK